MSPPPRPEADDYIGAKASHGHRKKHQARHARKLYNTRQHSSVQSTSPRCEICEAGSNESDADSVPGPPSRKTPNKSSAPRSRVFSLRNSDDTSDAKTSPSKTTFDGTVIHPKSPAVKALRRLSQPIPPVPTLEPATTRRISDTVAAALEFLTPRTPSSGSQNPEESTIRSLTDSPHPDTQNKSIYRDGNRRRPTFRDHLGTPATITLRKASNAYHSSARPVTNRPARSLKPANIPGEAPQISPPSVELVAFYSEHRKEASPQQGLSTSNSNAAVSVNPDKRKSSIAQISEYTKGRRQSAVADLATTFADVHIAPGTFAVDPKSRKASFASTEVPQRVSAVQFRSRNSVHEIIWREDETTSGSSISCSSHGSSSPDHSTQFQTIGGLSPESSCSPSQRSEVTTENGLNIPFLNSEQPSSATMHPQEKLFQFSWGLPTFDFPTTEITKHIGGSPSDNALASRASNPDLSQAKSAKRPSARRNKKGSVSEGAPHVSFPPLLDRRTTSDWCRAPLVDLDDPFAGRDCAFEVIQKDTPFTGRVVKSEGAIREVTGHVSEGGEQQEHVRRSSDHPYAPARLWESGKAGSSLGVSSHQSKPVRVVTS